MTVFQVGSEEVVYTNGVWLSSNAGLAQAFSSLAHSLSELSEGYQINRQEEIMRQIADLTSSKLIVIDEEVDVTQEYDESEVIY